MKATENVQREFLSAPCGTEKALVTWLNWFLGLKMPEHPVCRGHNTPLDYLKHVYFEPAKDVVVWAPRGGGKTRLAAAATLLDLLHKPGVQVRILAGSLDQTKNMWQHLLDDAQRVAVELREEEACNVRAIQLKSGSRAG